MLLAIIIQTQLISIALHAIHAKDTCLHCCSLDAEKCINTTKPREGAVVRTGIVVGSCCLAVVSLTTCEAIKVNSHLCASGRGDVVHT